MMSLPSKYLIADDYFQDVLAFLKEFEWLYNYPNTDILVNSIIEKFPAEWKVYFEDFTNEDLNSLCNGVLESPAPSTLQEFFNRLDVLKPSNAKPFNFKLDNISGVGLKKMHEIACLAPLVGETCRKTNAEFVVDIGSGQGYLSQLLHELYNYKVLGIEANPHYVNSALKSQNTKYKESRNHVKYVEYYITEASGRAIEYFLEQNFPVDFRDTTAYCVAGLHACADLSCTILDIFLEKERAQSLVIVPCCYHRMSLKSKKNGHEYFKCFPISTSLKKLYEQYDAGSILRTPFLRLACQKTVDAFSQMSEEQHDVHARSCLFRAVLQAASNEAHCSVRRLKRKTGKRKDISNIDDDFVSYLDDLKYNYSLISNDTGLEVNIVGDEFRQKMLGKWDKYKKDVRMVEFLTAFQAAIQSICENILLLDKVEYLKEKGVNCYIQKVADDLKSPRCYALVATKAQVQE